MLFGVGVSCRVLYSIVSCLCVSCSGSITSVGEERANMSAIVYLLLCGFCSERFPPPLGAWDGLRSFIAALPGPSVLLFTSLLSKYQYFLLQNNDIQIKRLKSGRHHTLRNLNSVCGSCIHSFCCFIFKVDSILSEITIIFYFG